MLIASRRFGVVEISWIVRELVRIVVVQVFMVATGVVGRRFVGGLVRVRSSVPTHSDALLRARSGCSV
jgi:hypothetical protein